LEAGMNDFSVGGEDLENLDIRASLDRHWKAVAAGQPDAEDRIYHGDAVLDYPQSGERIEGLDNIKASRAADPDRGNIQINSMLGQEDVWVTDYTVARSGEPAHIVSVMEFCDGKVIRETQYVGEPFAPPAWRAKWVSAKR
jgi:hypothetical protein